MFKFIAWAFTDLKAPEWIGTGLIIIGAILAVVWFIVLATLGTAGQGWWALIVFITPIAMFLVEAFRYYKENSDG